MLVMGGPVRRARPDGGERRRRRRGRDGSRRRRPVALPTVDRAITASIGLAVMPDHALDGETLVRTADRCLYLAKSNGRNRVETPHGTPAAAGVADAARERSRPAWPARAPS